MSDYPGDRAPRLRRPCPAAGVCALVAMLALAGASGCADNESSLFIRHVQLPNDECIVEADTESFVHTSG
jgi:hypothetical protein